MWWTAKPTPTTSRPSMSKTTWATRRTLSSTRTTGTRAINRVSRGSTLARPKYLLQFGPECLSVLATVVRHCWGVPLPPRPLVQCIPALQNVPCAFPLCRGSQQAPSLPPPPPPPGLFPPPTASTNDRHNAPLPLSSETCER